EYLLFLHADCRLPDDFQQIVQSVLSRERAAGAFRLRVQDPSWKLRWVEWGTNWRSRIFQTPYGDQALFLRACDFFDLGGFRAIPIMEDYEFIRRLARRVRIHLADNAVETSARRWQKKGVWRTTLINQGMLLGYHLGVPLNRLAAWYRS
ncbi:MAG: glycosyltransferase family 2 protein, partial [Planctomycetaceae bacterium]|nr:glycosyltransferase family 2 protein [Planctomycetaceae bacterium]